MSASVASPSRTTRRPVAVISPISSAWRSYLRKTRLTSSCFSGSTTISIRSWDSDSITSYGVISASRRLTRPTSISMPTPPRAADSTAELVRPAAPRSCIATTSSWSISSRQASIRSFSRNGLPTCTAGRRSWLFSSSSTEAKVAPWMPSRPVSAPTSITMFSTPLARACIRRSLRIRPTAMALTSGFSV